MKHCFIFLIIYCGLFNAVCGQPPSAAATSAIDSLVKFRIITAKQRPVLEKEIIKYKGNASYHVAILLGLRSIMLQKTFHIKPHKFYAFSYSFSDEYANKINRDSVNKSLRQLLEKINKAGLLTNRVYTYTLKSIDSNRYIADIQIIDDLAEMSSRLEWLAPDKLLPVAEELYKNDIVSDSSFLRLKRDISGGKIESVFQLNDYCKLGRTFDLTKYADDPGVWLEQFHRDMASTMPGLNFTNFNYTTTPDSSSIGSMPETKFKITLTCNGRIYKQSCKILNSPKRKGTVLPEDLFTQTFYRIFNKVLADERSPFRLHAIMFARGGYSELFSLVALREEQAEVFMKEPCISYMMVSRDNYDNTLTSARVDSTLAEWKKMGLFAHLSEAQIAKATDDAEAHDLFSMDRLLANFPRVIYPLDSAMMVPRHPYSNLLRHLAGITHGAFDPSKITERKVSGGTRLQYLFNGKTHSYTFNTQNGLLDANFPEFFKHLTQENNLQGNFYPLPNDDAVIYLTEQQYTYAAAHKLLDFAKMTTGK